MRLLFLAMVLGLHGCLSAGAAEQRRWQEGTPLPEKRWFHGAGAIHGGKIAVVGGHVRPTGDTFRYPGLGDRALRIYDPESDRWSAGPELTWFQYRVYNPRYNRTFDKKTEIHRWEVPNVATDPEGNLYWFARSGALVLDASGEWKQPGIPTFTKNEPRENVPHFLHRDAAAVGDADGRLYVIGGTGHLAAEYKGMLRSHLLNQVDVYDSRTNQWSLAAPMKRARQLLSAALGADGRIYVFGGCACGGNRPKTDDPEVQRRNREEEARESKRSVAIPEAYDPETDTWQDLAPMPTPRQFTAAARGADGRIYVIGGTVRHGGAGSVGTVEIYDPATDTWAAGPPLRTPRQGHTATATADGRIYVIGGVHAKRQTGFGYKEPEALDSVEYLDTARPR